MYYQSGISEQETLPLSAIAFQRYIQRHELEPLDIALKAGVRYLTIWKIWKGAPIKPEEEPQVRRVLFSMTGIPYVAPILVLKESRNKERSSTPQARKTRVL